MGVSAPWSLSSPQVLGLYARQVPPDDAFFADCEWELWPNIHKPFAVGPTGPPLCPGLIPGNGGAVGDFGIKDSVLPTRCPLKMDPSLIHPAPPEGIGRYVATTNNLRMRGRFGGRDSDRIRNLLDLRRPTVTGCL